MKRLLVLVVLLFACPVFAADIDFGWDANSENDLAGYRLYQSTVSGQFVAGVGSQNFVKEIAAPAVATSITGVSDGTYFWVLTAFDEAGNESDFSDEVSLTIDETPPAPPTGFWAVIKAIITWLINLFGGFNASVSYS